MFVASVCPDLESPENGSVEVVGHTATYSCAAGYSLYGEDLLDSNRACILGEWLGDEPACRLGEAEDACYSFRVNNVMCVIF